MLGANPRANASLQSFPVVRYFSRTQSAQPDDVLQAAEDVARNISHGVNVRVYCNGGAHGRKNASSSSFSTNDRAESVSVSSSPTLESWSRAPIRVDRCASSACTQVRSSAGQGNDICQSPSVASNASALSFEASPSIASALYKQ